MARTQGKSAARTQAKSAARTTGTTPAKKQAARSSATNASNRKTPAKKHAPGKTGGKRSSQQTKGGAPEGPGALTPIRKRQTPAQIVANASRDAGIGRNAGEVFTRSLMATLTRHIMRGAVGRVDVPYLGAALWRGRTAAQKERTMLSPILGRMVTVPERQAQSVARLRPHRALRDAVARI